MVYFTNFDSFIPMSYKHILVNSLIFQFLKICSSYEKLHDEIIYLKEIFKRSRYPNDFVIFGFKKLLINFILPKKISNG